MPDRPIFDVFDTSGDLRVRMGDISGRPWGGAGFVIPEGTFGLWTDREGAWLRGNVTMFYANSRSAPKTGSTGTTEAAGTHLLKITLDETFPFGSIIVPAGRVVTMEYFLHSLTGNITGTGVTAFTGIRMNQLRLRASRAGGAVSDFDNLLGPTTGTVTYSSVALRMLYHLGYSVDQSNVTLNWSVTRVASIRMFAHEVHADTTISFISEAVVTGGSVSGVEKGNIVGDSGSDPGGGSGTDNTTAGGDAPGGPFV